MHGVGGTDGVSECMRLDLIEGRAGLREWQDVAGSRWLLVVQFSSRCSGGLTRRVEVRGIV